MNLHLNPHLNLHLHNLDHLDPRAVTLPHGTEIVTRVERIVGERRVPQGTIGRVSKVNGDTVDITVVGIGVLQYARDEVLPRRVGQVLYAHRRSDAWDALHRCIVLDTVVGSRAWGLADEASDEDHRGVFALPLPWTLGIVAPPEELVSADGSATYWSTTKAAKQALRADPNTLEALFIPGATALDPIGEWMLQARDAFVSIEMYGTFGRYALGQLRRLEQGMRLAEHRATMIDWLHQNPALTLDALAKKLADVSTRVAPSEADRIHQAKQYIKQLYGSMHDQGLLDANEFAALVRFARDKSADFDLPRWLRPKNAYNLLRLLHTATRWLREGTPTFEVAEPLRSRLYAIKHGEVDLVEVIAEADVMALELESARNGSRLPRCPDVVRIDALVRRIGEELARRWVVREDGPFGKDFPPVPEATWTQK